MTCIMENGRLQNEISSEYIIAHAEFIFAKQGGKQVADDHRVLVLQLKEPNEAKTRVVSTKQNIAKHKAPAHMDSLEDYQPICFSPFCQQGPKRFEDIDCLFVPRSSRVVGGVWRCRRALRCWSRWRWCSIVLFINDSGSDCGSRWRKLRVFKWWCVAHHSPSRRCGVKLESLSEAILFKFSFSTYHW